MKTHDDLIAVLQVGTRRSTLPPSDVLPDLPETSAERRALILAGTLDLMTKAGVSSDHRVDPIPEPPEESTRIAEKSARPLAQALGANMIEAILEWSAKAAKMRRVAPPAVLVQLLPVALKHRELLPVLGTRGRWLLELQGLDLEAQNTTEHPARGEDPDAYRQWLESELDNLDWKERAVAVTELQSGLSLADEPVLERALRDRRKEVREPACSMLSKLNGSRVASELAVLGKDVLVLEKSLLRKRLIVNPLDPASLPKWLPSTSSRQGFGAKALATFDVLRHLPPTRWTKEFNSTEEQILDLAVKTEYSEAILDGLVHAALRFEDQVWIDTLFAFLLGRDSFLSEKLAELSHFSSDAAFDRAISAKLKGTNGDRASFILNLRKKPLSPTLTKTVLMALRTNKTSHLELREMATYLDPSGLSLVETPVGDETYFEDTRQQVRKILDTRKWLLASLDD